MTRQATCGATTLICEISLIAALARRDRSSTQSLAPTAEPVRSASALRQSHPDFHPARRVACQNATRELAPLTQQLERSLGGTDGPHAVMNPPRSEPSLRNLETKPGPAMMFDRGTRTSWKDASP